MKPLGLIWILTITSQQVARISAVDKWVMLVEPRSYHNPSGDKWDGRVCDLFWSPCDHQFIFCLDRYNSNTSPNSCSFQRKTTGEYKNSNNNNFRGIQLTARLDSSWTGSVQLKVYVEDNDSGHSAHDKVDTLRAIIGATAGSHESDAQWITQTVRGDRRRDKTTLEFRYKLYCTENYYGPRCSVFCQPQDSDYRGHYFCDPRSGTKVCRPGWENPGRSCKVFSNDCVGHQCQNGARCLDRVERYTCQCMAGYTGTFCEDQIDYCESAPCQHNGTCISSLLEFTCDCPDGFFGPTCALHVCDESAPSRVICQNGGSCYGSGQCLCVPGYVGLHCDVNLCESVLHCQNGATCSMALGRCDCPAGLAGVTCSVDLCDHIPCLNGGTCVAGQCQCVDGFTGMYCQLEEDDCVGDPCANNGTCVDAIHGFHCLCLPGFMGDICDTVYIPVAGVGGGDPSNSDSFQWPLDGTTDTPGDTGGDDAGGDQPTPGRNVGLSPTAQTQEVVYIKHDFDNWMIVVIVLAVVLFLMLLFLILLYCKMHRRIKKLKTAHETGNQTENVVNPLYMEVSNAVATTGSGRIENAYSQEPQYANLATLGAVGGGAAGGGDDGGMGEKGMQHDPCLDELKIDLSHGNVGYHMSDVSTNLPPAYSPPGSPPPMEDSVYARPPPPRQADGATGGTATRGARSQNCEIDDIKDNAKNEKAAGDDITQTKSVA